MSSAQGCFQALITGDKSISGMYEKVKSHDCS
jgi:hypothetical protein